VEVRRLAVTSQNGLTIGGAYEITDAPERRFTGTLIAPRSVRIALDGGASLEGSIPGRLNDEAEIWSLQARGDTVDGERLEFRSIPGDPTGPGPDADFKLSFDGGPGRPFAAVTPVVIDATLSRGTGLLYFVEFGDGFVTTKARDSHIVDVPDPPPFPRRPPLKARVTVVDRFGRSNAESADYFVFELGLHLPGEIDYQYWGAVGFTIDFVERHGATYIGQAERFRQFRTTARATLSGNGDIRITLEAVGIEYRGRIERIPSGDIIMRVVQSGGPDDGRAWELYLSSTF
jgi:hypothetical protein